MQPASLPLEVTAEELEALLESVREGLGEAGYQKLKAAIRTLGYLTELLRERKITLEGLRELLLSGGEASTEKTRHVLQQADIETQNVEIAGRVTGNINATDKVELKTDCRMVGDIKAPRILIADGASFKGNVDMDTKER